MKLLGSITEVKTLSLRSADGKLTTITVDGQTADRIATIPALASDTSFCMANAVQTLTNKTFPLGAGNSFLGINDTVAGYLIVSESVQGFMDGVRAMSGYGGQKGAAWTALTAAEISYLAGTGSSIQGQFTTNTQEHVTINERISALEGGSDGGTVSTVTLRNTINPTFADSTVVVWCFAHNTAAGDVTFITRAIPAANTTYQVKQDGTGTLTISGNGILIDGQNTKTLSTGEWCWLRLINGAYETIDENAVCNTDDIFQSTVTYTTSAQDTTSVAWVWAKFMPTAPMAYDLRATPTEGLTYHLSNKSAFVVTVQGFGGVLIDGQMTLVLAADDWAILHFTNGSFYTAARNGSAGGGGFASGTVEMTAGTLADINTEALVFIEKTYTGEATFTLKAAPVADDMRQIKNTGAGTLHVAGNSKLIAGAAALDLEPGDWAWLRYRDGAWYIADRSPSAATSMEISFVAGEALSAGAAVVLKPDTKIYMASSYTSTYAYLGDVTSNANTQTKKITKYSWLECSILSTSALLISIKSVGSSDTTLGQVTLSDFHSVAAVASGLIYLAPNEYLYWLSDSDPSTHFCRISLAGNTIYTRTFLASTTFIGVDKISTRTYYAVASNGTLHSMEDIGNANISVQSIDPTTSPFYATVPNCIIAFQNCALVVLTTAANTQRVLWYSGIGLGTASREVIIGGQMNRSNSCVHRVGDTAGVVVASTKSDDTLEFCSYKFNENAYGGLISGPIKTLPFARGPVRFVDSHLLEYNGWVSSYEYRIGFFTTVSASGGIATDLILDSYVYDASTYSFDPLDNTRETKSLINLLIAGPLGTPAVPVTGQYAQDGICTIYLYAQTGTYQYSIDSRESFWLTYLKIVDTTYPFLGITATSALQNASVSVKLGPVISGVTGINSGSVYSLGADGSITSQMLPPELKIGLAISSTTLLTKVYEG